MSTLSKNARRQVLAIIWQRFGPYHYARMAAASDLFLQLGWEVRGIEIANADHYAWQAESPESLGIDTLFLDRTYESLSKRDIRNRVVQHLDSVRPDAVAINGWAVPEALAAASWCRGANSRPILMSESHSSSGNWAKECVKRWRIRQFEGALVGGRWHRDYLVSLGFDASKIQHGYDAVDNDYFARSAMLARSKASELRGRFGLPEKYFFANTRFLPRKRIDVLLRAFAECAAGRDARWGLVISGSGECEAKWKSLAAELGLMDRVVWPGFVQYDELPIYYGLASAFVHIASQEAWGLVINEAVACGLPVIAGESVGATCELVKRENGILVDSDNLLSVTLALTKMASATQTDLDTMSRASVASADNYRTEHFARGLASLLNLDSLK